MSNLFRPSVKSLTSGETCRSKLPKNDTAQGMNRKQSSESMSMMFLFL